MWGVAGGAFGCLLAAVIACAVEVAKRNVSSCDRVIIYDLSSHEHANHPANKDANEYKTS